MGASDDYVAFVGDWFPPRTTFSSMRNDDIEPHSIECIASGNQSGIHFPDQNSLIQSSLSGNNDASNSNAMARFRTNQRGSLVERMAARAGFNAPRLNMESIKPPEVYKNPDIRSPYLTIPPGLSPTTLLESPVFLSNPMVHPSPTTGKLPFFPQDSAWISDNRDKEGKGSTFEETNASSYAFRAVAESSQVARFNAGNISFHSGEVYLHSELQHTYPPKVNSENNELFHQSSFSKSNAEENGGGSSLLPDDQTHYSTSVVDNSPPFEDNSPPFDEQKNDDINGQDLNNDGNSGEDGYNWRKYGQKHVKGIEFPRSYYKCTHQNCPVKKKVERSHEGHITEIIYKGGHNHPKPLFWSVMQNGNTNNPEYNNGGVTNLLLSQSGNSNEVADGVEESKNFSTNEDEGDELESKKMRTETPAPEVIGASRAVREPRVVVQTKSEVDILDDGYRWRKYGQKVVKGNPNPRSYYKCTSAGCNVRKHVERASHDLKSVITTYEGKHNHDVPAARNSNSGGQSTQQGPVSTNQVNRPKPCPVRGRSDWFERPQPGPFGVGSGFGYGMNQPGPTNFGLGTQQGNLQMFPVHTYGGNQVRPVNEMDYMMPKEELMLDSGYYQQLMNQLPLGPQM